MAIFCRYMTGLEKLEYAAGQVAVMQQTLQDLQPKLKKTSDETEEIMIKIERWAILRILNFVRYSDC